MSTATMDFFDSQDVARRKTGLLVTYYVLCVIFIMAGVYLAVAATFLGFRTKTGAEFSAEQLWNPELFLYVMGGTAAIVIGGTLYKVSQLSEGGEAIARTLGGRVISPNTDSADERKLLNVVEEMAIASGVPVPRVFLLEGERGINAFAAGFTPSDAVIGATRGCIERLSRDELQGVIAHEFSHILNGDMRLNIRLVGVLNGILVIALVGYGVLRATAAGSGRSRSSRGKGNSLPIFLLGLALMVIGYVGVFFAKLIKSAVSRQREYLADASSVQFTRNPSGIANALKKIGGIAQGSRLKSPRAEEASHFFFANGLTSSLFGLLSTHPPLEERIRRLDPAFTGEMLSSATAGHRPPPPDTDAPAQASRFAVDTGDVVASVGTSDAEHLAYASALIAGLPAMLHQAAREPFGARALVYALLLNKEEEPRRSQLGRLAAHADPAVYGETRKIMTDVAALRPDARLPLADLALTALRELSDDQFRAFQANVEHLAQADAEIDLFEYTLQRMIMRHLAPAFGGAKQPAVRHSRIAPLLPASAKLLSCLAYWGADEPAQAQKAFAAGAAKLNADQPLALSDLETCGLHALDEALDELSGASPPLKRGIIDACATCIAVDKTVTCEEAELLRAVGDALGCPIPPFLPGQKL